MRSTITPLPDSLSRWDQERIKREIEAREARGREIFAKPDDQIPHEEVLEVQEINDDLARLRENLVEPHPGHPTPPGARSTPRRPGRRFGRIEGLGDAFVQKMQAALDGTSGGATLPGAFFDPQIRDLPQRRLFLRSLIPTLVVDPGSDKVQYVRQTVFTNNAAAVAAGGTKPTTVITVERVEAPIRVIAHVSEAIDRTLLADHVSLASFVDNQLRLGVLLEEEDQILNGNGTSPNLTGILNTSGIQTQAKATDPTPDAVQKAITKVRLSFFEPDAIVFHPNDWQEVSLLRTADGEYVWGSPSNEADPQMWSLPIVTSPLIAEGTALVGAFGQGAEVYSREEARVTFAETGAADGSGDLFLKNQVRFRGESRIGLAVVRPQAFCQVTGV